MKQYNTPSAELLLLSSMEDLLSLSGGYIGDGTAKPDFWDGGDVSNSTGTAPDSWWG